MTTLFYKALLLQGEIWCGSLEGLRVKNWTTPAVTCVAGAPVTWGEGGGGEEGGHTRTRACVLLLRGWFLFGFQNLSGACYPSLCIYSHAANTSWIYIRKEESGNRKEREQAEAFVMRCKTVAVDREPDRCDHPRSRNHPLCWTLMDNSVRAAKVKIPQSVTIKCAKYYNQTYLSKSIIVWANRYNSIILEVV